tara:strand:+ start:555 stop:722 length:168 start_codon:yes stop_codon:yes gene_type:complete
MAGILRTVETFTDSDSEVHKDVLGFYKYENYNLPLMVCLLSFFIFVVFVFLKYKM